MNWDTIADGSGVVTCSPFVVMTTNRLDVVIATVKCMGYRHSRDDVVNAVTEVALSDGLAKLTYRRVAEELGISDRMVVYYLPSKDDLVAAAVTALSERMQALMGRAFGNSRRSAEELISAAWPVLTKKESDRVFQLFLEVIGLSAAKVSPYDRISKVILEEWIDWLSERVAAPSASERRRTALGVIAQIDGLLLLRHGHSRAAADEAALILGVNPEL